MIASRVFPIYVVIRDGYQIMTESLLSSDVALNEMTVLQFDEPTNFKIGDNINFIIDDIRVQDNIHQIETAGYSTYIYLTPGIDYTNGAYYENVPINMGTAPYNKVNQSSDRILSFISKHKRLLIILIILYLISKK